MQLNVGSMDHSNSHLFAPSKEINKAQHSNVLPLGKNMKYISGEAQFDSS
jgi:hypothetical protein